ncbi:MAG: hypothetical protein KF847_07945 [Pirellulales bacterium]|nr:hypothetical protein [Pirellulales bacterium]
MKSLTPKLTRSCAIALTSTAMLCAAASVDAAIVALDGFDDGNRVNTPDGLNWYSIQSATTPALSVASDAGGIGSGNALFVNPGSGSREIMGTFNAPIVLGATVGSTLTLSFDVRSNSANPTGQFRFGLYKSSQPIGTGGFGTSDGVFDRTEPGVALDQGAFGQLDFAVGNSTRIRTEANLNDGTADSQVLSTSAGAGDNFLVAQPASGAFHTLNAAGGKNSVAFAIERLAATNNPEDFRFTLSLINAGGTSVLTGSPSAGPAVTEFDYFVATATGTVDWVLDNFQIEVNSAAVPEASSLALLTAAALFGSVLRRRKDR